MKCDFEFLKVDPACPRFVDIRFSTFLCGKSIFRCLYISHTHAHVYFLFLSLSDGPAGSGLGDRFLQMLVGLTYAIHLDGKLGETLELEGGTVGFRVLPILMRDTHTHTYT